MDAEGKTEVFLTIRYQTHGALRPGLLGIRVGDIGFCLVVFSCVIDHRTTPVCVVQDLPCGASMFSARPAHIDDEIRWRFIPPRLQISERWEDVSGRAPI